MLTVVKAIAINVDDIAFCQDTAARLVSTAHGRTPAIPGPCARVECMRPAAQGGRARAAGRAQSRAVRAAIRARPCSGGRGPALGVQRRRITENAFHVRCPRGQLGTLRCWARCAASQ